MILGYEQFNESVTYKELEQASIEAKNALDTSDENDFVYDFITAFEEHYNMMHLTSNQQPETLGHGSIIEKFLIQKIRFHRGQKPRRRS